LNQSLRIRRVEKLKRQQRHLDLAIAHGSKGTLARPRMSVEVDPEPALQMLENPRLEAFDELFSGRILSLVHRNPQHCVLSCGLQGNEQGEK
jgi:hypothetical protein